MSTSPKRVLLLGASGMLGSAVWACLSCDARIRLRRTQRTDMAASGWFDALAPDFDIAGLLSQEGGTDFVINAAGLTMPEIAAAGPSAQELAASLNTDLPSRLARICERLGVRLIHISTDGVFSGKAGPYDEDSSPDPTDLYGSSKLAGEVSASNVLTLRCSIIGPDPARGRGLFEWFRRLPRGSTAKGFIDQVWNGVTTLQFAQTCKEIIISDCFDKLTRTASLRHFCPNLPVTKFELLNIFNANLDSGITVEPVASGVHMDRTLTSKWRDLNSIAKGPMAMSSAVEMMVTSLQISHNPEGGI